MSGRRGSAPRMLPGLAISAAAAGVVLLVVGGLHAAGAAAGAGGSAASGPEVGSAPPTSVPSPPPPPGGAEERPAGIAGLADALWLGRQAAAAGIPERALAAYAGAAIRVADEQPGCALGWNTLAAIGLVESDHGRIAGEELADSGRTPGPIIGIPLDGRTTEAIADTDGGALDGDTRWDRAVGPLQFIPSTWARWGADGDEDGMGDPQQIDDAALAAARYLCADGRPLTDGSVWTAAVRSYNDAPSYLLRVADAAAHYAAAG